MVSSSPLSSVLGGAESSQLEELSRQTVLWAWAHAEVGVAAPILLEFPPRGRDRQLTEQVTCGTEL